MARLDYSELNSMIRYTMWSVFRSEPGRLDEDRSAVADQVTEYLDALADKGVVVRGVYALTGMRADADFMIWWHADNVEALQAAYSGLREMLKCAGGVERGAAGVRGESRQEVARQVAEEGDHARASAGRRASSPAA